MSFMDPGRPVRRQPARPESDPLARAFGTILAQADAITAATAGTPGEKAAKSLTAALTDVVKHAQVSYVSKLDLSSAGRFAHLDPAERRPAAERAAVDAQISMEQASTIARDLGLSMQAELRRAALPAPFADTEEITRQRAAETLQMRLSRVPAGDTVATWNAVQQILDQGADTPEARLLASEWGQAYFEARGSASLADTTSDYLVSRAAEHGTDAQRAAAVALHASADAPGLGMLAGQVGAQLAARGDFRPPENNIMPAGHAVNVPR